MVRDHGIEWSIDDDVARIVLDRPAALLQEANNSPNIPCAHATSSPRGL